MKTDMTIFEDYQIRRVYDEESGIWWFSVVDIVQVLIKHAVYRTVQKYWNKLKQRLGEEDRQLVTDCNRLQSVPSLKTEPIRLRLARQVM